MHDPDYRSFSIIVKPVGSHCNLQCDYCYYLGKSESGKLSCMSNDVLEQYIRSVVALHGRKAEIEFAWHGGEPTLCGIDFFRHAVQLQRKYATGRKVLNTLQTNGTLLNDEWCRFFATEGFRIGISIDGPERLHNVYRKDTAGNATFERVMRGVNLLRKHGVEYNTLTTVNATNASYGNEVYGFLRSISDYMQFLPVVECADNESGVALPPGIYSKNGTSAERRIADFSVLPQAYGNFLCDVFEEWRKNDVGRKFVQTFEAAIGNITRRPAGLCVHEAVCGHCAVVERDGTIYRCERFVFDEYRMGNICHEPIAELMESNRAFGEYKLESLPPRCLHCDVAELCFGGCPKDRIEERLTLQGVERHNYLCEGYRLIFRRFKTVFASRKGDL